MPKRRSDDTVDILSNKLRKLEKVIKCMRRPTRHRIESSVSSSSRSSSRSRSRSTSRDSTPVTDKNQDRDISESTSPVALVEDDATTEPARAPPSAPAHDDAAIAATAASAAEVPPPSLMTVNVDDELDPDVLEILGSDPTAVQKYGADIYKDLANRFNHIVTKGLEKENRKQLIEKYLVPANCAHVGAPKINPEIKAAIPDTALRRDKAIEARQTEIAAAISCLGQTISSLLKEKNKNHDLLRQLMDSGRIMCDIQYSESISRRNFALYSLKKDMKEQLTNAKIDTFLFGEDLSETLRTAKAVTKSGSDLKIEAPKKSKSATYPAKNLNWKTGPASRNAAPGPARRPAHPQAPPPQAGSRPPPASSSRPSSQRTRTQTRTR